MSHTDGRISKYLEKDDIILCEINIASHDGYDSDGPESNLYDLYLFFERNLKIYKQNSHDEDWFNSMTHEDEYFMIFPAQEIIKKEYEKILKDYSKSNAKVEVYKNIN